MRLSVRPLQAADVLEAGVLVAAHGGRVLGCGIDRDPVVSVLLDQDLDHAADRGGADAAPGVVVADEDVDPRVAGVRPLLLAPLHQPRDLAIRDDRETRRVPLVETESMLPPGPPT